MFYMFYLFQNRADALTIFISTETFLSYKYKKRPEKQDAGARMFKTSLKPFTMQGRASRLHYYLIPGIRSKFAPNCRLGFPTGRDSAIFWEKGTTGQKFLHCPGTKGQRDKLKLLPRDETGQDFLRLSRPVPGRPAGQNQHLFCTFMPLSD